MTFSGGLNTGLIYITTLTVEPKKPGTNVVKLAAISIVEVPMASPAILAGIKTAAVINVGTATLGALIGAGDYGEPILTGVRLDNFNLILEGAPCRRGCSPLSFTGYSSLPSITSFHVGRV
jgi:ABC-type proline/glycine betaine transport system permease subunit